MAVFYGLYTVGILGTSSDKHCLTNYADFFPYPYQDKSEYDKFMKHPGAVDMTQRFWQLMLFGLTANVIFVSHLLFERRLTEKVQNDYGMSRILLDIIVNLTWIVQFIMVQVFRWSHGGSVCAGDYAKFYMKE